MFLAHTIVYICATSPYTMKRILFFASMFLLTAMHAQFVVGWSGGYAPARELNREIYVYNAINGHNLSKEMNEVHWYQGPAVGFRSRGDVYVELLYSRKRSKVTSEFDSSGVLMTRQMKVLCNTWNFGVGFQADGWRIGASFDLGRFKGFGRRGVASDIGDKAWDRIWTLDNRRVAFISMRLICTETVYVERYFGLFNVRAYVQFPGINSEMDGLDTWMFGSDLNFGKAQKQGFLNVGAMVSLAFGR